MSFFPILRVPGFEGSVTIHNYSPNNFESSTATSRHVYVSWADGASWRHHHLMHLDYGRSETICDSEIRDLISKDFLPFVFLTERTLPPSTTTLREIKTPESTIPNWRGTISIGSSKDSVSSYQGEVDPFPPSGTCLTFNYLRQPGENIKSWLLALNLENKPSHRPGKINFFDYQDIDKPLHTEVMASNAPNAFLLPKKIASNQNIVITCRDASFIPIFLSHDPQSKQISLEHTHPPASSAIYGNRFQAQKIIKSNWFSKLSTTLSPQD